MEDGFQGHPHPGHNCHIGDSPLAPPRACYGPFPKSQGLSSQHALLATLLCPQEIKPPAVSKNSSSSLSPSKFPTCLSITHIFFAHSERLKRVRDCHLGPCPEGLASPVAWPARGCPHGMPRACHPLWTKVTEQHKEDTGTGVCFKTSFISLTAGGINIHCKRKRLEMSHV